MKRYEIYEVRGRRFALALTIQSELDLEEKFGENINISDVLYSGDRKTIYKNTVDMLEIMANEGSAYAEIFEGKSYDKTTAGELMHFLKLADINEVREKLTQACIIGWKRDVELEEDEEKNVSAPGD